MKSFLLIALSLLSINLFAQRNCPTADYNQMLLEKNPDLKAKMQEIERYTDDFIHHHSDLNAAKSAEIIIPVVFHVVYFDNNQNISDQRILEQIDVLNQDFNALNSDINDVPAPFQSSIGSFKVKFVLANRDASGKYTTGIERVKTSNSAGFSYDKDDVKSSATGGVDAWDTRKYLNIWVCNLTGDVLGYATFPYSAGSGLDGVVLTYKHVGVTGATKPYNLGRTATHEVGHYFNLLHIWGNVNNSCSTDDGILDTPNQYKYSSGKPSFPKTDNCTSTYPGIMFMNYMDYSDDAALLMFTTEQASRMLAAVNGPRASLLSSSGYVPPDGFDIAVSKINSPASNLVCNGQFTPSVSVVSLGADIVNNFQVEFLVDGIVSQTTTWTGSLTYNKIANVLFNPVEVSNGMHKIGYRLLSPAIDRDKSNDTLSKYVQIGVNTVNLPLTESFETSDISVDGFSITNPDSGLTWQRSPRFVSTLGSFSYFMNNFDYDPEMYSGSYGEKDDIVFPFINLTNYTQASLKFDLSASQYTDLATAGNTWDTLQVLASTDCGNTFQILYNKYRYELVTAPVTENYFVPGSSGQWRTEEIDLKNYCGMDNVLFMIRNISHFENNIYIDNLNIRGVTVTNITDLISDDNIQLYPNPSQGDLTIRFDKVSPHLKRVDWYNSIGQNISSQDIISSQNSVLKYDFSNQPKGLYIVNFIFDNGKIASKKVIFK